VGPENAILSQFSRCDLNQLLEEHFLRNALPFRQSVAALDLIDRLAFLAGLLGGGFLLVKFAFALSSFLFALCHCVTRLNIIHKGQFLIIDDGPDSSLSRKVPAAKSC